MRKQTLSMFLLPMRLRQANGIIRNGDAFQTCNPRTLCSMGAEFVASSIAALICGLLACSISHQPLKGDGTASHISCPLLFGPPENKFRRHPHTGDCHHRLLIDMLHPC